ncbi:MAG: hypothetical protein NW226_03930 [Microscillaceae bacterium]|nr:hypothetical protein [Microscillaceae bacterium]
MKYLWIWTFIFGILPTTLLAQDSYEHVYDFPTSPDSLVNLSRPRVTHFIEVGIGGNGYKGDLASYEKWTQSFHLAFKLNRKNLLNSRFGFSAGFITGENRLYRFSDASGGRTSPNTFFRTSILTFDYELQINLYRTRSFMLYLSQGIGFIRFESKDENGESLLNLQETRAENETYNNFAFMLPTGLGATYLFKNGYGLGAQAGFLNTQSDYLDNIAQWGVQSGNDNILRFKFYLYIPLKKQPVKAFPKMPEGPRRFTHY